MGGRSVGGRPQRESDAAEPVQACRVGGSQQSASAHDAAPTPAGAVGACRQRTDSLPDWAQSGSLDNRDNSTLQCNWGMTHCSMESGI